MRRVHKRFAVLLSMFLVLGLLAGCGGSPTPAPAPAPEPAPAGDSGAAPAPAPAPEPAKPAEPVRIAAIFAATGPASSLGKPERDTVLMIQEQVNAAGGINGRPLEIVFTDTESDSTKATLAMKKAAEDKTIVGIIGGTSSGESLAMLPEAEKNEVPYISVAAAAQIIDPVNKWVFKTPATDRLIISRLMEFLKSKNYTKVAWASANNAYGDGGRGEFERMAAEDGITIVANERFNLEDTDMTAQFTRIKAANPQAVIIWSTPPGASVAAAAMHQLGIKATHLQSHGIANMAFIDQAGEGAEGAIFPSHKLAIWETLPADDPIAGVAKEYVTAFQSKYNYFPTTFGAHAYDALHMFIDAVEHVGTDRAKVRDHIEGLSKFVTAGGVFNYTATDHLGLATSDIDMVLIKGGKWVRYTD